VAPSGSVVASDIDVRYMADLDIPCLEVRRLDVIEDAIEDNAYDFVVARALLHHLPARQTALRRMIEAVKPGGAFLSIEPDMLPCTVAEPGSMRAFWQAWLKWSEQSGIDYFVGRRITAWLDGLGMEGVAGEGDTMHFNGGSDWATYWTSTVRELAPSLPRKCSRISIPSMRISTIGRASSRSRRLRGGSPLQSDGRLPNPRQREAADA
jgi:SAM-dependent methyltransferase